MFKTGNEAGWTNPERKRGDRRALAKKLYRFQGTGIPSLALRVSVILLLPTALAAQPFRINIVDDQTNRGVPLVELRTVNGITHYTDSNGIVAFDEPGLFDKDVFFHISSHGYEFAKDGFGIRGKSLRVTKGGEATLKIKRLNIAERLYRITGGGIYRDSVLVGAKTPLKEPLLNGLVFGSDSVVNAVYKDRIHWFWGDTNKPSYPIGNFQVPGATSELKDDPDAGINLSYFVDSKGFAKQTMKMPGKGATWMVSLVPLEGKLYASYIKVEAPMKIYARGIAVWDDKENEFKHGVAVDMKAPAFPAGPAFVYDGHVYFSHPFPLTRVKADAKSLFNVEEYETFTCLKTADEIDRDEKGALRYAWRKGAPLLAPQEENKLVKAGKIMEDEQRWQFRDRATGKHVAPHAGSVYWNEYRNRWIMIFTQTFGTSFLGEVWFAEAKSLTGPWHDAVKIVTHDKYSFYNPKQHPMFDRGKYIYFEGTYTHTFSGNPHMTPRYDYNQIMYRLDLSDPRLTNPERKRGDNR